MELYISINGVLRNLIQKLEYHYKTYYFESSVVVTENEEEESDDFEYKIEYPIRNDDLENNFKFHNSTEFLNFLHVEFPVEIYGHAGISYPNAISDLNKFIFFNKDINVTLVGLDEFGKSRPATLFFLSRNGVLINNLKFITSNFIDQEWEKCDAWITDNRTIIEMCPINKKVIKFNTDYNGHFDCPLNINKIEEIEKTWLKSLEKNTTSI